MLLHQWITVLERAKRLIRALVRITKLPLQSGIFAVKLFKSSFNTIFDVIDILLFIGVVKSLSRSSAIRAD